MKELHLKIFGEVQDVGFRYSTMQKAQELDLTGWVRNTPEGSLEILAQGEKKALEKLIGWAKTGPRFAGVENVEVSWHKPQERFLDFQIRY